MKTLTLLLSIFFVSCASTRSPQEVFGEYCQNGKQIKKYSHEVEMIQTKVRDASAAQVAEYWEDATASFLQKQDWYKEFALVSQIKDDDDFFEVVKTKGSAYKRATMTGYLGFRLYRTEIGKFIWTSSEFRDEAYGGPLAFESQINTMFDNYIIPTQNRTTEDYARDLASSSRQESGYVWHLESTKKTQVTTTPTGVKLLITYDLAPYCKNAVPAEYMLSQ